MTFRLEVSKQLQEAKRKHQFSVADAARALGIRRQAFYQYLKGATTPRPEVLIQAIKLWDLKVDFKGYILSKDSFPTLASPSRGSPVQLQLFKKPMELRTNKVVLRVSSRDENSLSVEVLVEK